MKPPAALAPAHRNRPRFARAGIGFWLVIVSSVLALPATLVAAGAARPVSFQRDVVPILKRSCTGCHHPGKLKGELDLTTYAAFAKGGKHGASFAAGDPKSSRVLEEVSGAEPSMPKEGDPLSAVEVGLLERWIAEGAKDDTSAEHAPTFSKDHPPVYIAAPVIPALACSPDGQWLAVAGYHEILLHHADGSGLDARLIGASPRLEALAFSADGQWLAASGGAPAQFGEIQIWEIATRALAKSYRNFPDSLYGVSFAPDGASVAFGCADKTVRLLAVADGRERMKFDNHSDWVLGTTWTLDGRRLVSGSRDRALKLISAADGQFIDDINKLLEGVLCLARHPKEDRVAYGGELGTPRIYKIAENQGRTAANNDVNLVREFERQPGPVHAIAFSPDGAALAVGGLGSEVRLYQTSDGARSATLKGHGGAVFALAFHPQTNRISTAGFDGHVRLFNTSSGEMLKDYVPVPLQSVAQAGSPTK